MRKYLTNYVEIKPSNSALRNQLQPSSLPPFHHPMDKLAWDSQVPQMASKAVGWGTWLIWENTSPYHGLAHSHPAAARLNWIGFKLSGKRPSHELLTFLMWENISQMMSKSNSVIAQWSANSGKPLQSDSTDLTLKWSAFAFEWFLWDINQYFGWCDQNTISNS